jgi:hypothetical protein
MISPSKSYVFEYAYQNMESNDCFREAAAQQKNCSGRRLWAVHVGQIEIVWLDRGDAANGGKEPSMLNAVNYANGSYRDTLTENSHRTSLGTPLGF